MPAWLSGSAARAFGALLLIAALLAIVALRSCQSTRSARTAGTVSAGQAGAAIASGGDAANTIGNRMAADAAGDALTRTNDDAIRNAPGADAPVDPAVRDAGLAGLCRRAAYLRDPRCVQHADP